MSEDTLTPNISLCDALDRILTKGVVVHGDISISVAGVDLLYIGLRGLLCAIDALGEVPQSLQKAPPAVSEELSGFAAHAENEASL